MKKQLHWVKAKDMYCKWRCKVSRKKTGISIWVPELRLRWDKIHKLKYNIKSKDNFTQIGPGLRPYLGKIVLLFFQNLFSHWRVASDNSLKIVHWLWNVCFSPKSVLFPWSANLRTRFCLFRGEDMRASFYHAGNDIHLARCCTRLTHVLAGNISLWRR